MKESKSNFKSSVCDCGNVNVGGAVNGEFVLNCDKEIRKCDGGCTCGGKPRITFTLGEGGFSFNTVAKVINGKREVTRVVTVSFSDRSSQIVYIKYRII
ncbi:MAG: hypothetical protein II063_10410 [Prevotella sp.]|nr:hypothetical protein [Prevotella sp.]